MLWSLSKTLGTLSTHKVLLGTILEAKDDGVDVKSACEYCVIHIWGLVGQVWNCTS